MIRYPLRALPALLALVAGSELSAQIRTGVQGGLNFTTFAGADAGDLDMINLWQLGGVAQLGGGRTALMPALVLTRKGAAQTVAGFTAREVLTYVQVPVLVQYLLSDAGRTGSIGAHLYAGPAIAVKLACSVTLTSPGGTQSPPCGGDDAARYRSNDFSAVVGFGVEFGPMNVALQYEHGLTDIADNRSFRHQGVSVVGRYFIRRSPSLMR